MCFMNILSDICGQGVIVTDLQSFWHGIAVCLHVIFGYAETHGRAVSSYNIYKKLEKWICSLKGRELSCCSIKPLLWCWCSISIWLHRDSVGALPSVVGTATPGHCFLSNQARKWVNVCVFVDPVQPVHVVLFLQPNLRWNRLQPASGSRK